MSLDEFKFVLILTFLFFAYIHLLQRDLRRTLQLFSLSCAIGLIAQILLGRELNLYTPNITLYVSYISVAVIMTWGAGLTTIWAIHTWLARILHISPGVGTYTLCGLPILILLEFTGSNIIRMKLHDYRQYTPLMPYLNAMHAPKWLYAYYIAFAMIFFYSSKALGIYCEDPDACAPQGGAVIAACSDVRED